jgi:hypothetical protein
LENKDDYDETLPLTFQDKLLDVPISIRSLATFYNPYQQDAWKNLGGNQLFLLVKQHKRIHL